MAHFAELDTNNVVLQVVVISNDAINNEPFPQSEPIGVELCKTIYGKNTVWKQTSYNNSFRAHYAAIGYLYDPNYDVFITPQPYPSWTLNTTTFEWEAPIPMPVPYLLPKDGGPWIWDEATQSWVKTDPSKL